MTKVLTRGLKQSATEKFNRMQLLVRDEDLDDIQVLVQALLTNDPASDRLRRKLENILAEAETVGIDERLAALEMVVSH
jgi:copper homeostasis protein CutC